MQQQNIWGAYLAFPPIYKWPFGMQTLVQCATCHNKHTAHSFVLIPQFAGEFKIKKKKKLYFVATMVQRVKIFQAPKLLAFVAYETRAECRQTGSSL